MKKIDFSKFFLIEDNTVLSLEDKTKISYNNFNLPFIWSPGSTTSKFPYYGHTFIHRPKNEDNFVENIVSNHFYFYFLLIKKFCYRYNIQYKRIIRANINSTFFFPEYEYLDPHVDFSRNHLVVLIYLNDVDVEDERFNSTVIFDRKFDINNKEQPYCYDLDVYKEKIPIKCEIKPEFGKIICFNGAYYHSNRFPKPGENRLVCVFNLLI